MTGAALGTRRAEGVGRHCADHREGRLRRPRPRPRWPPRPAAPSRARRWPSDSRSRPSSSRTSSPTSAGRDWSRSQRGADGGYWLARPPADITVADVIRAVEGPLADVHGTPPETVEYQGAAVHLQPVWIATRCRAALGARGGDRRRRGRRRPAAVGRPGSSTIPRRGPAPLTARARAAPTWSVADSGRPGALALTTYVPPDRHRADQQHETTAPGPGGPQEPASPGAPSRARSCPPAPPSGRCCAPRSRATSTASASSRSCRRKAPRSEPERLELKPAGTDQPLVTSTLAPKRSGERGRRNDRGPRPRP